MIGYIVISIVLLFLIFPLTYFKWKIWVPVVSRTVAFTNVATLSFVSVQEPVRVKGVVVGSVSDVSVNNDTAFVKIETNKALDFYEGYSVTVVSKGVMGDRYIDIFLGDKRKPVIPSESLLVGKVNTGADDALLYMESFRSAVHTLTEISEILKNGSVEKKSLILHFRQFTVQMDSIIRSVASLINGIDASFKQGIDSALIILDNTMELTKEATNEAPKVIKTINNIIYSIEKAMTKVDTLISRLNAVIEKFEDSGLISWKDYTKSIRKNLIELQSILHKIEYDPITLPVKLY